MPKTSVADNHYKEGGDRTAPADGHDHALLHRQGRTSVVNDHSHNLES